MPNFIDYEVAYTNVKPFKGFNSGSGTTIVSIPEGTSSVKAKLKRKLERKLNSLLVRIDSFKPVNSIDQQ